MAGRILNRRELRKQTDLAEQIQANTPEAADDAATTKPVRSRAKANKPAAPRVRKVAGKKALPRMRVRWGIFDPSTKQVAIFDYNQRAAADERLADLLARNKGLYYLLAVKELMTEPIVVE